MGRVYFHRADLVPDVDHTVSFSFRIGVSSFFWLWEVPILRSRPALASPCVGLYPWGVSIAFRTSPTRDYLNLFWLEINRETRGVVMPNRGDTNQRGRKWDWEFEACEDHIVQGFDSSFISPVKLSIDNFEFLIIFGARLVAAMQGWEIEEPISF